MTRRLLILMGAVLLTAAPLSAQNASVSGRVTDETGAVLPGASVTLSGAARRQEALSGANGDFAFRNVTPGTYQLVVTMAGFGRTTQAVTVAGPDVDVAAVSLKLGGLDETVIVSASKLESAIIDAPATMSVVSAETIASSPAQNYGDLLRSVPGVNVIQLSARDVNLTARQGTSTLATSQLTLLDGRSLYLDFFGLILWDFVPSNMGDIKQIEVVRGPASVVWGANALTGVVNIITKTPREAPGGTVTFTGGLFSRDAGSTRGRSPGSTFGAHASYSAVANDRLSYRLAGGYYRSDPFPRPTGRIPLVQDPRDRSKQVGGGTYPADAQGAFGTAFRNSGTSQPKFDVRVDQEIAGGRVTYAGGVAGTEGMIYTGIGPFDIQSGSKLGYVKTGYTRGALKLNVFGNFLDGEAPNLLLPNPQTNAPLQLDFKTQTFDVEVGHATAIGTRHALSYGGNVRRNAFDITLAPNAKDRTEAGAYVQDEIFVNRFRFAIGARVDKSGGIDDPVFSPRLSATYKPVADHAIRLSFNRAFRSPSVVNNFLDIAIVSPVDLRGLAPLLPPPLQPLVASPFPLLVKAVGSELPIGTRAQAPLKEESLTAYEIAYTGTVSRRTTFGVAFYVNDVDDNINFAQLSPALDPYTAASPPPGWRLPPVILAVMAQRGILLPRTAFTYLNLGPVRHKGVELSLDQRFSRWLTGFANYSWQATPKVLDDPDPYPSDELSLPPTHRFNVGASFNGATLLGSASVNYSDGAFWSDVLNAPFHGFTDSYTMVNGSVGVRWRGGRVTTSLKSTNMFNQKIQQHVFGDILTRQVVAELKLSY